MTCSLGMVVFGISSGWFCMASAMRSSPEDRTTPWNVGLYTWAPRRRDGQGPDLDAPPIAIRPNYPARLNGTSVSLPVLSISPAINPDRHVFIPNGVMLLLTLFAGVRLRKCEVGHFFGVLVIMTLFILVGMFDAVALRDDSPMASSGAR